MTTDTQPDIVERLNPQPAEVEWYRRNGKHPERIAIDGRGHPYVIGDWSWNRGAHPREWIESRMAAELGRDWRH